MPGIGIVGGGRGATLHAEAVRAVPEVELVGVGGRPGTAGGLAAAVDAPDLALADLVARADALVLAVPPDQVGGVLAAVPIGMPVMVESPVGVEVDPDARPGSVTAVNLLHAPLVTRGLTAIHRLGDVHHLQLRVRGPRPRWGAHREPGWGGVLLDPAAGVLPVLLAAAARPVVEVTAVGDVVDGVAVRATVSCRLDDGRRVGAELGWHDGDHTTEAELEAAAASGVVTVRCWPRPELEIDGRPVAADPDSPLVALGFAPQIRRFGAVVSGRSLPWPDMRVGAAVMAIAEAAARSIALGGRPITPGDRGADDPASWFDT